MKNLLVVIYEVIDVTCLAHVAGNELSVWYIKQRVFSISHFFLPNKDVSFTEIVHKKNICRAHR